eukprot:1924305-Rhodomonas_salina.2
MEDGGSAPEGVFAALETLHKEALCKLCTVPQRKNITIRLNTLILAIFWQVTRRIPFHPLSRIVRRRRQRKRVLASITAPWSASDSAKQMCSTLRR